MLHLSKMVVSSIKIKSKTNTKRITHMELSVPNVSGSNISQSPDRVIITPFLDGSLRNFSLYRIPNITEEDAVRMVSKIYNTEVCIETQNKAQMFCDREASVLAEYSTEETILWFLPISQICDPRHLNQYLIHVLVPAKTLIIHTNLVVSNTHIVKYSYASITNMNEYIEAIRNAYELAVPKLVSCFVNQIRPKYQDLGEWLEDTNNLYIANSKAVFSTKLTSSGKKEKFVKHNSFFWKDKNETEEGYRARINSIPSLYEVVKGKSLGCWCQTNTSTSDCLCHGRIIIDEFRKHFIRKLGFAL